MADIQDVARWLEESLPALLEEHHVPGASIALQHREERATAVAGVLNLGTREPVLTDSIFQIGSITKVWTATLVMQLVSEARIGLDDAVQRHLPAFRIADEAAAAEITVRQLLTHTSGFEGDVFTDTGRNDDCIRLYVDQLIDVPQLFSPGEMFSYNNAGFCVLGRLLEVLEGASFDEVLRRRLVSPLGLRHVACDPYQAVLHSTAVGHLPTGADAALEPTTIWSLARSNAPAGSMLAMRATDLLAFAQAHLSGDPQILEPAASVLMREQQVAQPDILQGSGWGLGWERFDLAEASVFGHDGATIGQSAYLRIFPDEDVAFALLTNGGDGRALFEAIARRVYDDLAGAMMLDRPVPDPRARATDPERVCGRYRSASAETTVSTDATGRLWLHRQPIGEAAEVDAPYSTELVPWRGDSFLPLVPESGVHTPVAFLGADRDGRARFLHTGRALPRVGDETGRGR